MGNPKKIKILSNNTTQQANVITKARTFGAISRDGDYNTNSSKTAIVINTKLGEHSAIQVSRVDFTPKDGYGLTLSYKDFMNATVCPWDNSKVIAGASPQGQRTVEVTKVVEVETIVEVEVPTGICAQNTLKVKSCDVLVQDGIIFSSKGLPFLAANGVTMTEQDGVSYIIDTQKNNAYELTAEKASANAKASLIKGDNDVWSEYAKAFDLVTDVVLHKVLDEDGED